MKPQPIPVAGSIVLECGPSKVMPGWVSCAYFARGKFIGRAMAKADSLPGLFSRLKVKFFPRGTWENEKFAAEISRTQFNELGIKPEVMKQIEEAA